MGSRNWFEVDHGGLAEIAKRRGMAFIVTEPIQNAWDEATKIVTADLVAVPGVPKVDIAVTDDSPDGFADLADSYRMFRESRKLANPEQRGRFNVGEKLLLAMADYARVTSTTGSVIFDERGRRRGRKKTDAGSVLTARLRMTRSELDEALVIAKTLIPPTGVVTIINGETLPERESMATGERALETEVRGEDGGFKYTTRKTALTIYKPLEGEEPHLYEMGIPIDTIGCPWHVSVGQKVPLSVDRGSVRYGYVAKIEAAAAEIMAAQMTSEQSQDGWVSTALPEIDDDDAVRAIIKKRFGKAVVYDPSDPEANKRALDAGFHVVRGGELSKRAWASVRRAGALRPAGRVFKAHKVESSPDGAPPIPESEWTVAMKRFAWYAIEFAAHTCDRQATRINFYRIPGKNAMAFCGGGEIGVNLSRGGQKLIDNHWDVAAIDRLLIHECAHFKASDHLTDAFHDECCRIGAALKTFYTNPWDFPEPVPETETVHEDEHAPPF